MHFPRPVLELVNIAFAVRRDHRAGLLSDDQIAEERLALACRLEDLVQGRFCYEPNFRLAKHLAHHPTQWSWFLIDPTIDATNYRAEQAVRPAVVNRKVWRGNRNWICARSQSVLTSVLRTCTQLGRSGFDYLVRTLCPPVLSRSSERGAKQAHCMLRLNLPADSKCCQVGCTRAWDATYTVCFRLRSIHFPRCFT